MISKYKFPKSILFALLVLSSSIQSISAEQSPSGKKHKTSSHDIKVGERLFNGLVKQPGQETVNCASCHNVYAVDTFNWNPSAYDIALSTAEMTSVDFKNLLLAPSSTKLMESHKNFQLSDDQIKKIRLYLAEFKEEGQVKPKPVINKLIGFIICVMLLLFSITDLLVIKKLKPKALHGVIQLVSLSFIGYVLVQDAMALGRQQYYEPDQPIKFSHKVHAGDNQIDCLYCHHTAEESKSAGIPAQTLCLNCHTIVREGTHSGKFEINKIDKAVQSGKPVEWIRIHNLPDHVYFNHSQHVEVGKLECQECHGPVEEMDRVYQYNDLSMGWCLDCHRTKKIQFENNNYYKVYEKFHEEIKAGKMDSVIVTDIGGQDCQKCHY